MSTETQHYQELIALAEESYFERANLIDQYEQNIGRHGVKVNEISKVVGSSPQTENRVRQDGRDPVRKV